MVFKAENQGEGRLDWLKWLVALVLLLAGLVGNHYYSEISMPIRTLVWLAVLAIAGFVISRTQKGRWVVEFFRESRGELRKVVWPTREETMQTTLVVAAMVIILALLLWGMDSVLVWLIGWLTGQRG
ncbi:Protein translocase subunit SecE [Aquicella lusitana]|uniref:Protein translocase subunit SecE n=1 Tax=Aquicella lusitana TaxID=254246 RepID=A0A370GUP3_9COXI|nr:preprotein translocase subunit SecE [Aquicella lusitana]RDI46990.1 protein translocase subunit secE/sec61 gamma [Aquicella lusitana]VVC73880.1 Protein translocase subunit SecE [Aquicella lusitana]